MVARTTITIRATAFSTMCSGGGSGSRSASRSSIWRSRGASDMPLVGVGLPWHFVVKYPLGDDPQDAIFLDPFAGGALLTPASVTCAVRGAVARACPLCGSLPRRGDQEAVADPFVAQSARHLRGTEQCALAHDGARSSAADRAVGSGDAPGTWPAGPADRRGPTVRSPISRSMPSIRRTIRISPSSTATSRHYVAASRWVGRKGITVGTQRTARGRRVTMNCRRTS